MTIESVRVGLRAVAGLLAGTTLVILLYGIWRGSRRRSGRTSGRVGAWQRSPWFYLLTTILFIGLCIVGWVPLPVSVPTHWQGWVLLIGSLIHFPGMGLLLWARLVLARDYFVSSSLGAQVFAGQRLVIHGPYRFIRHPMYTGLLAAALGSLLLFATWTTLLFAIFAPFILLRARREEQALSIEFGEQWREYCRKVPPFLPCLIGGRNDKT